MSNTFETDFLSRIFLNAAGALNVTYTASA